MSRDAELREVLGLLEKASSGPWRVETDGHYTYTYSGDGDYVCDDTTYYPEAVLPDNQYAIAAAVNFVREHDAALATGRDEDGWVPVSERLPPERTAVLAATEFDGPGDWRIKTATLVPEHPDAFDGWLVNGGYWKPSHWRELPPPPAARQAQHDAQEVG
jgi:hypothetical protein